MADAKICAVDGCEKPRHAHGFCARHAYKFKTYGDPLAGRQGSSPGEPLRWIHEHAQHEGDECLRWPFEVGHYGYGVVRYLGKRFVASRVMCTVAHGEPPTPDHHAAHSCGKGHEGCVNPRHLRWATRSENSADAKAHGTWVHGERVASSVLTAEQAAEIFALKGKVRQTDLAKRYGVGLGAIGHIHAGERWRWMGLGAPPVSDFSRGEKHYYAKLTASAVRDIRSNAGLMTARQLAERHGVSPRCVRSVWRRETWAWVTD